MLNGYSQLTVESRRRKNVYYLRLDYSLSVMCTMIGEVKRAGRVKMNQKTTMVSWSALVENALDYYRRVSD